MKHDNLFYIPINQTWVKRELENQKSEKGVPSQFVTVIIMLFTVLDFCPGGSSWLVFLLVKVVPPLTADDVQS